MATRNLWSGYISFGLVTIPVTMYPATESKAITFNYLHRECGTPLKYDRICTTCNTVVPWRDVVKGYEYEKGKWVAIDEEDLASIPFPKAKTIDIVQFVDLGEIDPIYFDKSYYLAPEEGAEKAYALLARVLQATNRIAVAKVVIKTKQHLCCIRHFQNSLLLETMFYPDEIRSVDEIASRIEGITIRPGELRMATQLVDAMTEKFEPEKFRDEFRDALRSLIQSKISGIKVEAKPKIQEEETKSLIEALKASVESARSKTQEA